ncbi:MAG: hypothetical protein ACHQC8_06410 [Solirubrobacterales bacterium]
MALWMVTLDTFYDDYKRPSGDVDQIGMFSTRRAAIIAGVTAAAAYNAEHAAIADDFWEEEPADTSEDSPSMQHSYKKLRGARDEYVKLSLAVLSVDFNDDEAVTLYEQAYRIALEDALGPAEYGVKSTGGRPTWEHAAIKSDIDAVHDYNFFWTNRGKEPAREVVDSSEGSGEEEEA